MSHGDSKAGGSAQLQQETDTSHGDRVEPVRHRRPLEAIAVVAVFVVAIGFISVLVSNPAFQWDFMTANALTEPVLRGALTSIVLASLAMLIGGILAFPCALLLTARNPVLRAAAWLYTWFFRAVPRIVLLVLFGNLGILFAQLEIRLPFERQIGNLVGLDLNTTVWSMDTRDLLSGFMAALLGLVLSEIAYMAEIVRAGLRSVGPGQAEAAKALGMSSPTIFFRVVLPQALRAIAPPTGNEAISMMKDTALVAFVPVTNELFFQLQAVGNRTFNPFPMLVAACGYYLVIGSLLMALQWAIERRLGRSDLTPRPVAAAVTP